MAEALTEGFQKSSIIGALSLFTRGHRIYAGDSCSMFCAEAWNSHIYLGRQEVVFRTLPDVPWLCGTRLIGKTTDRSWCPKKNPANYVENNSKTARLLDYGRLPSGPFADLPGKRASKQGGGCAHVSVSSPALPSKEHYCS